MKSLAAFLMTLATVSTSHAAPNCLATATKVAQLNLNAKAKAYGFGDGTLAKQVDRALLPSGSTAFRLEGYIYKGVYKITVQVDSACGVESVTLVDIGN